ncbi:MAG: RnfABCDGE type electron transport complex subunit D [Clostridiales bacterium]|jgi:electron transport complex protein RnfD|nr:RnfABCDGE type electron transport complex subunit D [Clostridiales bacterium]
MTLKTGNAPHLRQGERSGMLSLDVLIVMIPLCIFSSFYYGLRPVLLVLTGIGTALICETVCCLMMKRRPGILDGTAAVTGGLVGLLMPPAAPYWMPVVAAAFAILVAKMPFGGTGRNLFNPAAAGIAVVTLCFSGLFFLYPDPGLSAPLPLNTAAGVITEASPAAQLAGGGQTIYMWSTLLLGDFPGPIGATAVAVLAACALYLFTRRTASPLITVSFLLVCAASAVLFPRVSGVWQDSVMLELCSGYLLFCGVFLLTDPVTAPRHWLGRIVYGALAGVLVMALRYSGRFEEGACFAVLLVNAFSPLIDRFCWKLVNVRRLRREGWGQ